MSAPSFERVAVVGLGLLGGSVAAAARARGVAGRVIAVSRGRETAAAAVAAGLADEGTHELGVGVAGADLVVLSTPVFAMAGMLSRAAPSLAPGAIVTDVGSVKGALVETLPGLLPPGVHYVGAHPMAGSHETGLRHADAGLFEGAACVLTPTPSTPREALAKVRCFWEALGARVLEREPEAHDAEVAWVSHLPHALAFGYAESLAEAPAGAFALTGGGFRDFTRIAASDPELWADILVTNRKALAGPLASASRSLARLAAAVEAGDLDSVQRLLAAAREGLARAGTRGVPGSGTRGVPGSEEDARSGGRPGNPVAREATPKE